MKQVLTCLLLLCASVVRADGVVTVKSVTAQQRNPWTGLVDIAVAIQGDAVDAAEAYCVFVATNTATQAVIPVMSIRPVGVVSVSGRVYTHRYLWNATVDVGVVKIDDLALTVDCSVGVQLWENGPYWAECNVGATKPHEYGYYFWWGDTVGYKYNSANNGWVSVKDGTEFSFSRDNCPTYGKNNSQLQSAGYIDSTGNLVPTHDAATAHFGRSWRMPTAAEFKALIDNCNSQWTTMDGVYGRLVTGRGAYASKSIFLPAAGYAGQSSLYFDSSRGDHSAEGSCWSSTPASEDSYGARTFLNFCWCWYEQNFGYRYSGQSVRPLRGFVK